LSLMDSRPFLCPPYHYNKSPSPPPCLPFMFVLSPLATVVLVVPVLNSQEYRLRSPFSRGSVANMGGFAVERKGR